MDCRFVLKLLGYSLCWCGLASASSLTFTCDPSVDVAAVGTCSYLNTTVAAYYTSTFSNLNANIYIQMGTTGLGESTTGFLNLISYNAYRTDLINVSSDAIDSAAVGSLPASEPALYSGGQVEVTSALGEALGIPDASLTGTTALGASCQPGTLGCYNGIITITTAANLASESGGTQTLYWNQLGGSQPANAYDFYSVVEHETDEVLGTSSCVSTTGATLSDSCAGANNISAVDLFRYTSAATRVFEDTTPGAYFSYNGGTTNGAGGAVYNTLLNGDDYADFASNCAHVQDATGCLGQDFNITNDGNSEINILDAIGYTTIPVTTPEPSSMVLLCAGAAFAISRKRNK